MYNKVFVMVATASLLFAQQSDSPRITVSMAPGGNPIHPSTCEKSVFGYLDIQGRTVLSPQEIGQYVIDRIGKGFIVTIYPETKDGIAVSAFCRKDVSASR